MLPAKAFSSEITVILINMTLKLKLVESQLQAVITVSKKKPIIPDDAVMHRLARNPQPPYVTRVL